MHALAPAVMGLKGTLHSTGTPDIKSAVLGGSALVYGPNREAVKPQPPRRAPPRAENCEVFLLFHTCGKGCGKRRAAMPHKRPFGIGSCHPKDLFSACEEVSKTLIYQASLPSFEPVDKCRKKAAHNRRKRVSPGQSERLIFTVRWRTERRRMTFGRIAG
jgi:hypothetical protein